MTVKELFKNILIEDLVIIEDYNGKELYAFNPCFVELCVNDFENMEALKDYDIFQIYAEDDILHIKIYKY